MENITTTLQAIVDNNSKTALKSTKAQIAKLAPVISGFKHSSIKENLVIIADSKRKADMLPALDSIVRTIIKLQESPDLEKMESEALLLDLSELIKIEVSKGQQAFMNVGEHLTRGLKSIKDTGGKQKDFLLWADASCHIKKAQAYKLMSVYSKFGKDSDFAGVSMRVLYTLISQEDDVLEACKVLALSGKLDTKAMNAIIEKYKPIKKITEVPDKILGGTVVPSGSGSTGTPDNVEPPAAQVPSEPSETPVSTSSESDTIKALTATIEDLKDQLQKALAPAPKQATTMPDLPQFYSESLNLVLGISLTASTSKEAINKAYRAMAKIWTLSSNPDASNRLKVARDTLLKFAN